MASAGVSQEPPHTGTLGRARNWGAVCGVMPPVGQKATSGKGPASAFSIGMPPAAVAGKNLTKWWPPAWACITSLAVATPGSSGSRRSAQASPTSRV